MAGMSLSSLLPLTSDKKQWGRMIKVSGDRLYQWRQWAQHHAIQYGIAQSEVDWLLQHYAPALDALALRLDSYRSSPSVDLLCSLEHLAQLWKRRVSDRIPVQHLTGTTPWRNFSLDVSPAVLIPRPETELVIDLAIHRTALYPDLRTGHWVDMGTGSGAIALGLADAFPSAIIHAIDVSADALAIARKNAAAAGLGDRIQFHQGNWFTPIQNLQGLLSGIVSNPPYIPSHEIPHLQPEVAYHEPHLALDGGADGLHAIRQLATDGKRYLKLGGFWLVEMMAGQANSVGDMLNRSAYQDICIHRDLSGTKRFVSAYH